MAKFTVTGILKDAQNDLPDSESLLDIIKRTIAALHDPIALQNWGYQDGDEDEIGELLCELETLLDIEADIQACKELDLPTNALCRDGSSVLCNLRAGVSDDVRDRFRARANELSYVQV